MWGEAHIDVAVSPEKKYASSTEDKKSRIDASDTGSWTARPVDAPTDMTIARNLSMLEKIRRNSILYCIIPISRLFLVMSINIATPNNGQTPDIAAAVLYLFNISSMLITPAIYAYCHDAYRFNTFATLLCMGGLDNAVESLNSHSHSKVTPFGVYNL